MKRITPYQRKFHVSNLNLTFVEGEMLVDVLADRREAVAERGLQRGIAALLDELEDPRPEEGQPELHERRRRAAGREGGGCGDRLVLGEEAEEAEGVEDDGAVAVEQEDALQRRLQHVHVVPDRTEVDGDQLAQVLQCHVPHVVVECPALRWIIIL